MIKLADLMRTFSNFFERQRQLDECRRHATGDVEYYAYSFIQDLQLAEKELEQTLNAYIDQRVVEKLEHLNPLPA